jgi:two-component system, NtrC family, response regulator AtoC
MPVKLIAQSEAMQAILRLAQKAAVTQANVLITGESGTGKDLLASQLHAMSARAAFELVRIDCASLPGELFEAELFGYERGAFTGAVEARPGRLEAAHHGTLVLDEIAQLPIEAQAKLLRVIEQHEFDRLGGRRAIRVDARLIALTNVDLEAAVKRRAFREDLYFRLNVLRIHVPPLRERRADIPALAENAAQTFAAKHGRPATAISTAALKVLCSYDWPGNVRELSNMIERAVIVGDGQRVEVADLPAALRVAGQGAHGALKLRTLAELERDYVLDVLEGVRGNKSAAARILGISRKNLYERLERAAAEVEGKDQDTLREADE